MKRKGLYIILALSITCTMFTACKKNDSVESANVVEEKTDIIESVTEEIETTTSEEVESAVETVESTEEAKTVTAVEEEPTTEVIEEDDYVEPLPSESIESTGNSEFDKLISDLQGYYEQGLFTKEEYEQALKEYQEGAKMMEEYNKQQEQQQQESSSNYILPEGTMQGTPADPSKDGQYHLGQGGELPAHLRGKVIGN